MSLNENFAKIDGAVIGNTYIITGPSHSGKTSMVYWALRNDHETHLITIDCDLYHTELQFIQKMIKEIGIKLKMTEIDKKVIYS